MREKKKKKKFRKLNWNLFFVQIDFYSVENEVHEKDASDDDTDENDSDDDDDDETKIVK